MGSDSDKLTNILFIEIKGIKFVFNFGTDKNNEYPQDTTCVMHM
jgi:hypothetical protein